MITTCEMLGMDGKEYPKQSRFTNDNGVNKLKCKSGIFQIDHCEGTINLFMDKDEETVKISLRTIRNSNF